MLLLTVLPRAVDRCLGEENLPFWLTLRALFHQALMFKREHKTFFSLILQKYFKSSLLNYCFSSPHAYRKQYVHREIDV
jgi:hypothetical protein